VVELKMDTVFPQLGEIVGGNQVPVMARLCFLEVMRAVSMAK
jgi:hypothetical protein